MFDKLIELLAQWWNFLMPAVIIPDYEEAVLLRAGRFKKVLKPGFHVKIPIIDEVVSHHVVVTTLSLSAQSLYTKDKQNVVVKGVVKYKISDVKVFLLEVFDKLIEFVRYYFGEVVFFIGIFCKIVKLPLCV